MTVNPYLTEAPKFKGAQVDLKLDLLEHDLELMASAISHCGLKALDFAVSAAVHQAYAMVRLKNDT